MPKNKEYELAIKIAGEVEKSFYESTKLTKKELRDIAKQAARSAELANGTYGSIGRKISEGLKDAEPAFSGLERAAEASFTAIKAGAAMSAAALSAITTASVAAGSNFEEQMSTVQAISMASGDEVERLNEKAKELGKSTKFSASEVGQGFEYMAMAGWKTEDMLSGIGGVLDLAAASGEDLGAVSDIVTDAMTAFGLGSDQAGRFADVLAAASSNANTNVSMMGETFRYVAPVAGALGYEIEDTAVAIGLMANSGIKASQAGTALRSMFSRLSKPTAEVQSAMEALNLSLTDKEGNMKSFLELQKDMRAGFAGMADVQKAEVAAKLAGQEAMSGILAIANSSDADFEKLTEAINNSAGAAEKMSEIRLDNLKGDLTIMRSAAEGFGIDLYENLSGPLRDITQMGTAFIGDMAEEMSANLPTMVREAKNAGEAIGDFAEPFLAVGGWLAENPGVITGSIAGIGSALAAYKVSSGISALAGALKALTPEGQAILAIGAVTGVITGIGTAVKKAANDAKKANLDAHFGDIALSLADLQETAAHIVQSEALDKVRESVLAMDEADGIADSIRDTTEALNKMNWKVSMGMELGEAEQEEYRSQIESYIQETQDYLTQQQYAVNIAVGVLTDDDLEGNNIVKQINEFYAGKQAELQRLGTELNHVITDAFTDGLLDIDEVKEITELQAQMAEIQNALADADTQAQLELIKTKYPAGTLNADSFINLQATLGEMTATEKENYENSYLESVKMENLMLQEGQISQAQYDRDIDALNEGKLRRLGELQAQAADYENQVIREQYADEIGGIDLDGKISERLESAIQNIAAGNNAVGSWDAKSIYKLMDLDMDKSTKAALSELWEVREQEFAQQAETVRQMQEAGMAVPESIRQGMLDSAAIGALVGDQEAIYAMMGEEARTNPEYQAMLEDLQEQGTYIPEQIAAGIRENKDVVQNAVLDACNVGIMQGLDALGLNRELPVITTAGYAASPGTGMPGHADGGIFTVPHVAWFAEDGPEAAIPLDGSRNAIDLWEKTGELLGMDGLSGGAEPLTASIEEAAYNGPGETVIHVDNSRVLNFNGSAPSKEELAEILDDENEEFARKMEIWMSNNRRFSFS